MNNLFRITKNNVDNFFIEYDKDKHNFNQKKNIYSVDKKNRKNKINNGQNIIEKIPYTKLNEQKLNFEKTKIVEINKTQTKIQKPIQIPIVRNFNCEIKKINSDNDKMKISNKIKITNDNNLVNLDNNLDSSSATNDVNKIILEYGKSGIKQDVLKKLMKKNLYILEQIDNLIRHFLNFNPKLKLNTLINDNENKSDNMGNKKIYWNNLDHIIIENEKLFNVIINGKTTNKEKKYNLIDFGYIKIYNVNFTEEFINKHKIPSLDSIIKFSDNIKHFLKIIKLLDYTNKYKIKINQLSNTNLLDIIYQNLPTILSSIGEKKNIFNSTDKKFTFYLKITIEKTTAFIIDKNEKLLYFFNSIENDSSAYIFFYILKIDTKYKIINYNHIKKQNN